MSTEHASTVEKDGGKPYGNEHPDVADKIDQFSGIYGFDGGHLSRLIYLFV